MDPSILLPTTGSPWIIPLAKVGLHFLLPLVIRNSLFSVPVQEHCFCPFLLCFCRVSASSPAPWTPVGFYMQKCGGGVIGTSSSKLELDRFRHWWSQFREEVESAETQGTGGQLLDVSFPEQPEVNMWALFEPPLPNSKLMRKLPLNLICETH